MNAAAPAAPWECQRVRCLGLRVASNVQRLHSFLGLSKEARVSLPAAICSQSNVRERGSAIWLLYSCTSC
eukprot:1517419-Prorocentrum_lima.AAC.1